MIRSPSFLLALVLLAIPTIRAADSSSDDTLRFAIICDRTGGMRPGVFERAVEKINSLDPEFVMSVGDLIDGYTESPIVWTAQWDEFDAIIKNFKLPFHAVVGNHDISNPKMREAWVQRRGATHYAFVRKDVLFLVLDSEDLSGGDSVPGKLLCSQRDRRTRKRALDLCFFTVPFGFRKTRRFPVRLPTH